MGCRSEAQLTHCQIVIARCHYCGQQWIRQIDCRQSFVVFRQMDASSSDDSQQWVLLLGRPLPNLSMCLTWQSCLRHGKANQVPLCPPDHRRCPTTTAAGHSEDHCLCLREVLYRQFRPTNEERQHQVQCTVQYCWPAGRPGRQWWRPSCHQLRVISIISWRQCWCSTGVAAAAASSSSSSAAAVSPGLTPGVLGLSSCECHRWSQTPDCWHRTSSIYKLALFLIL